MRFTSAVVLPVPAAASTTRVVARSKHMRSRFSWSGSAAPTCRASGAAVAAHQLGLAEDVPAHRVEQLGSRRARLQGRNGVEGVQLERVAVRLAPRWAGTVVAEVAKVVAALPATVG